MMRCRVSAGTDVFFLSSSHHCLVLHSFQALLTAVTCSPSPFRLPFSISIFVALILVPAPSLLTKYVTASSAVEVRRTVSLFQAASFLAKTVPLSESEKRNEGGKRAQHEGLWKT